MHGVVEVTADICESVFDVGSDNGLVYIGQGAYLCRHISHSKISL